MIDEPLRKAGEKQLEDVVSSAEDALRRTPCGEPTIHAGSCAEMR
ncbi:MAG: hypothetical protein ACJ79H_09840 [Myxococcales bacterium]